MPAFADVALPSAVRREFTYALPDTFREKVREGQRVWVPFRNYFAIGIITRIHDEEPDFETKDIRRLLDQEPVLDQELMKLTNWVSRFYFSSWGETIQAALPAGMNFVSRRYLRLREGLDAERLQENEQELIAEIRESDMTQQEAENRWQGTAYNKVLKRLLRAGDIEIWEEPDLKVEVKTEKEYYLSKTDEELSSFLEENNDSYKWVKALQDIVGLLPVRESALKEDQPESITSYTLKKLQDEAWISYKEVEVTIQPVGLVHDPASIKELNEDQSAAFRKISDSLSDQAFANFLLFGVTGSGKTEVYIHALKQVREAGKGGIVLVPEIALTPQTVARFYRIFGDEIAVLHSRMSQKERLKEWQDLRSGKKSIAIGPRSAVFAPVQDLGLIIMDEEHDSSYKQIDPAPRYHARETAIMRATLSNAVMIMGSATPSMQALHMAARDKCELLELHERHAEASMPEVEILDLRQYRSAMRGDMAVPLFLAIQDALKKGEQIILLYNRRGYGNYMQCETCGHIPQSPECSVSLTYHKRRNILMCHYSGYSRRADTQCVECGSPDLKVKGTGTQQIEEQLKEYFPDAGILRFDRDSTTKKGAHASILDAFGDREADILIGTQLVAKGLDFPNVTVVGVIDADTEQAFPSFQSSERMYQLLSQVAGRSGRGDKPGKVFIQTRQPDNPAIQYARLHDHRGFAKEEMKFRKPLSYPPFSRLIKFIAKDTDEAKSSAATEFLKKVTEKVIPEIDLLGPSPAAIAWVNRKYIWELTLKVDPDKGAKYIEALVAKILEVYENYAPKNIKNVRINVNVDCIN
ncbi:primosomal protein N' [Balneola sp. MJW-20]|uniref:replication restart helicase PriA n=1 Tax=Gracilimonas aurantiaca TaxID=3234185 RepID=UPI003466633C